MVLPLVRHPRRRVRHAGDRRLDYHQIPVMPSHLPGPDHRGMEPRRHVLGPVTVSRIGFGAMQLPGPGVFGPPRDRTAAIAVLRRDAPVAMHQQYIADIEASSREALASVNPGPIFKHYGENAGVASATVTVGQILGGSIGTSLLNTIFAAAVTSYITCLLYTSDAADE